jgi:hypothetical protein
LTISLFILFSVSLKLVIFLGDIFLLRIKINEKITKIKIKIKTSLPLNIKK